MKSKYTLSALATAAAVAFGGVAIAQVSSGENTADTSVSADANASATPSANDSLANSDRIGDNNASGSLDTQTMGASGSGLNNDTSMDSDTTMNTDDSSSDDLLAPQADRG